MNDYFEYSGGASMKNDYPDNDLQTHVQDSSIPGHQASIDPTAVIATNYHPDTSRVILSSSNTIPTSADLMPTSPSNSNSTIRSLDYTSFNTHSQRPGDDSSRFMDPYQHSQYPQHPSLTQLDPYGNVSLHHHIPPESAEIPGHNVPSYSTHHSNANQNRMAHDLSMDPNQTNGMLNHVEFHNQPFQSFAHDEPKPDIYNRYDTNASGSNTPSQHFPQINQSTTHNLKYRTQHPKTDDQKHHPSKISSHRNRSKKPKFHIDLDNINNNRRHVLKNHSGKFGLNETNLNLRNVMNNGPSTTGNIPVHFSPKVVLSPKSESGLDYNWNTGFDNDLVNFGDDPEQQKAHFSLNLDSTNNDYDSNAFSMAINNVTPGMKPPGTDQFNYFERNFESNLSNPMSGLGSQQVFFSPQINYTESTLNNFSKNFEQYLSDAQQNKIKQEELAGIPGATTLNFTDLKFNREMSFDSTSSTRMQSINEGLFMTMGIEPSERVSNTRESIGGDEFNYDDMQGPNVSEGFAEFKQIDENVKREQKINGPLGRLNLEIGSSYARSMDKTNVETGNEENYGRDLQQLSGNEPIKLERTFSNQSDNSSGSVHSTANVVAPSKPKKKRNPKGAVCSVCDKYISRDLTRHMRIHNEIGRFQCVYPKYMCNHKTQYFNRPYDYKKHLLHMHFKFDDPTGKAVNTLTDKLPLEGTCLACDKRFIANDWINDHVLTTNLKTRCAYVENKPPEINHENKGK